MDDLRTTYVTATFPVGAAPSYDEYTEAFPWEPFASGGAAQFGIDPRPVMMVLWRRHITMGALRALSGAQQAKPSLLVGG